MIQIEIKNFGPISEANIRVGGLTIFAGANNTGKSFASRLIYSIMNSLQSDLYIERASEILNLLSSHTISLHLDNLRSQRQGRRSKKNETINSISKIISLASSKAQSWEPSDISSQELITFLEDTKLDLENYSIELESNEPVDDMNLSSRLLDSYLKLLTHAYKQITQKKLQDSFVNTQLQHNIERELIGNFRVPSIATLIGPQRSRPTAKFADINNNICFTLTQSGMDPKVSVNDASISQYYPSNIFLESPIYWKIGTENLRSRFSQNFGDNPAPRQTIPQLPAYVSSLRRSLLAEYSGDVAFPEILEWLNKQNAFPGKLVVATGGQLRYYDGRREYSLQTTATGITNIGFIGLLIERKLINERTILFIDEPEADLHPAWQVLMAKLLLKLAQAGIGVVLTTHSVDILKYIEISAKADEGVIELVSLNHFPHYNDGDMEFFDRIRKIKNELTDPYYRMFIGDV